MGALPPFRQIQFNQIPGAPPWFAAFLTSLNGFMQAVYDIADKRTTLGENVPAQFKSVSVQVGDDGTFPAVSFQSTLRAKPQAVLLAQVQQTKGAASSEPISLNQWTYAGGMVKVDSLIGLAPGRSYDLTFLVF